MAEHHYSQGFAATDPSIALHEFDEAQRLMPFVHFYRTEPAHVAVMLRGRIPMVEVERRIVNLLAVDPNSRDMVTMLVLAAHQAGDQPMEKVAAARLIEMQRQSRHE